MSIRSLLCLLVLLGWMSPGFAQDFVPGEVIVKLKDRDSGKANFMSKSSASMTLKKSYPVLRTHKMALKSGADVMATVDALNNDPDVEYAEPNYYLRKSSTEQAQGRVDYESAQAAFYEVQSMSGSSFNQSSANIQAEQAWDLLSGGATPPVIAVIDTGVDYNHDVFQDSGAMWVNPGEVPGNGIDDDNNGYIDDIHGWNFVANSNSPIDDDDHGTHVAGIILGSTQNILASPIGSAQIRIMALKFLDDQGIGTTTDAIEAIHYAINNGAKVLNNSWGGGGYSQALRDAIVSSNNNDLVFIAAAGNQASNNDSYATYPANYDIPNVFSVAATNDYDYLASFSNYGKSTVHIASPGVSIYSTLAGNSMGYLSGTSMAAPFVAGLAAMMVHEESSIDGFQVKTIIEDTANRVLSLQNRVASESRINMYNAVNVAATGQALNYQPGSNIDPSREIASEVQGGGCAAILPLIKDIIGGPKGPSGPANYLRFLGLLLVLLSPVMILLTMRNASKEREAQGGGQNRRRYDRFKVDTQVQIFFGSQQLCGAVSCISLGGVRIDTHDSLHDGDQISMKIQGPDEDSYIEASGEIVWSKDQESYGVKFNEIDDMNKVQISEWTKVLEKD